MPKTYTQEEVDAARALFAARAVDSTGTPTDFPDLGPLEQIKGTMVAHGLTLDEAVGQVTGNRSGGAAEHWAKHNLDYQQQQELAKVVREHEEHDKQEREAAEATYLQAERVTTNAVRGLLRDDARKALYEELRAEFGEEDSE